jgi:multimeric flavodoxin WrbA
MLPIYLRMKEADGIILASPVYYGSATSLIKGLMERAGYIARWNGEPFHGKVGGPLVVARRAGKNFLRTGMWLSAVRRVMCDKMKRDWRQPGASARIWPF